MPERTSTRRFVVIALIVIALLGAGEGVVRVRASALPIPQRWLGPEMGLKELQIRDLNRAGGASTIFLGSSTVDVSVDPSMMRRPPGDRPLYNASTGAGSIRMISTWAQLLAVPQLHPDTVVLGVVSRELNPNDPEQARLEREFFEAPAVRHLLGTENAMQVATRRVEGVSDLFKYRTVVRRPPFFKLLVGLGRAPIAEEYGAIVAPDGQYQGFLDRSYIHSPPVLQFLAKNAFHRFEIGSEQVATIRRLVDYLSDSTKHVIIVNMPVTRDYVDTHPRGEDDYDSSTRTLKNLADDGGARFLDPGIWDGKYFADPAHLNARGSKRLSKLLDRTLAEVDAS